MSTQILMKPKPKPRTDAEPITWEEGLRLWKTSLQAARKAGGTVYEYHNTILMLRDRVLDCAFPGEVTLQHVREFQVGLFTGTSARKGKPLAASTVSRMTTTVAGFFRFLTAEEKIDRDPTLKLEQPKKSQPVPGDVLNIRETERFLAAPDVTTPKGLRDKALVELYYSTGLRLNEALALDLSDLSHGEREVRVRHGKGDKGRIAPVTRSAWKHLVAYLEQSRPVLATTHADSGRAVFLSTLGRRMCQQSVMLSFRRLRVAAKIKKNVTPHCLRRTCATDLLKNGVNIRVIQVLLGHTSLTTTAKYLRLDASELRRIILLHHPRERFAP